MIINNSLCYIVIGWSTLIGGALGLLLHGKVLSLWNIILFEGVFQKIN